MTPDSHSVHNAMLDATKDKTLLLVTHDLRFAFGADLIHVMQNGKLVQSGTHQELLAQTDGAYHELWSQQMSGSGGLCDGIPGLKH